MKRLTLVGKASGVAALAALTWTAGSFADTTVGPWLDIANRPPCGNGVLEPSCSSQTGRKVLLGIDGVLQAAGAVSIVLGAVLTGRHTEIVTAKADPPKKPHVNVLPSQMGRDGYGLTAFGDF